MTLTVAALKALQPGQSLYDDVVPGLQLRAFPTRAIWNVRYRTKTGRERRHRIGPFPGFSIEGARKAARAVLEQVAAGRDPGAEIAARRGLPTMNVLCDLYIERHLALRPTGEADQRGRPVYAETDKSPMKTDPERHDLTRINGYIRPGIGRLLVAEVQQSDIEAFLAKVQSQEIRLCGHRANTEGCRVCKRISRHPTAPVLVNRVRALLSTMFGLAMTQPYGRLRSISEGNPAKPVERNKERKRKRIATPDEMKAIAAEMDRLWPAYPRHIAALWTIWTTGARKTEIVKAATTDRVERFGVFKGDRLVLPKHKTAYRTGEGKTIHLPEQVTRILQATELGGEHGLLFGRISVDHVWRLIRKAVGCTDLTIHDIRRTFISVGVAEGKHTLKQMGSVVGHGSIETTNGYAYLLDQQQRAVVQRTADAVEGFMRPSLPRPAAARLYRRRALRVPGLGSQRRAEGS